MITSIKLKSVATYPENTVSIENCQKINFFYGPNGSGKTTISNYLDNPSAPQYESCSIEWENDNPTDIVVYNKEFRTRHFQENIDGVFTLGEATIEEMRALEELKKAREAKSDDFNRHTASMGKKEADELIIKEAFKDKVWDSILKPNESDFQDAFSGFRASKEKFRDELILRYRKAHTPSESKADLKRKADVLFKKKPEKCELIDINVSSIITQITTIERDPIWNKIVIGNKDLPISKLIEYFHNDDWVNKGRTYIRGEICPFCQQPTITKKFEEQINEFFSGQYDSDIKHISDLISSYGSLSNRLHNSFDSLLQNPNTVSVGKIDLNLFTISNESLSALLANNLSDMQSKEKEPSKKIELNSSEPKIQALIDTIQFGNNNIVQHNKIVENFNDERKKLIDEIWACLISENTELINNYIKELDNIEKAKRGIQDGINRCKIELDDLDNRIFDAGKNITSVQPTVDEINRSLKAYGFTNFKIVPSPAQKNAYQIQRMDGTLATNTLSEGEETFISFLYFLQFAKGAIDATKVSSRKILVIDDPICSLDSTVLYIVSSMVKSLIKSVRNRTSDVEQIFILTHNVFFHKEASFIDGRSHEFNDIYYWIISKDNNISTIRPFEKKNPIKTSYELLWQELKSNSNASLVTTQNIMRRIIENYFSILGKEVDERIVQSFDTVEDQMICRSLISWINDGSHSIPDDLYIDSYTDSVERYKCIFKEIFVKMDHKAHYDMMMA